MHPGFGSLRLQLTLLFQRIALKTVQKLGFSATAADNGKEALDWLQANPVDIIVSPGLLLALRTTLTPTTAHGLSDAANRRLRSHLRDTDAGALY